MVRGLMGTSGRGLRHAFRALRHRDFALFWSGAFVSSIGMWMQNVTVPFLLHEATGSAALRLVAQLGRPIVITQGRGSVIHARPGPDPSQAEIGGLVVEDETRQV